MSTCRECKYFDDRIGEIVEVGGKKFQQQLEGAGVCCYEPLSHHEIGRPFGPSLSPACHHFEAREVLEKKFLHDVGLGPTNATMENEKPNYKGKYCPRKWCAAWGAQRWLLEYVPRTEELRWACSSGEKAEIMVIQSADRNFTDGLCFCGTKLVVAEAVMKAALIPPGPPTMTALNAVADMERRAKYQERWKAKKEKP